MTPDYRALCAELNFIWGRSTNPDDLFENMIPLIDRARALLGQPEPGGPTNDGLVEALKRLLMWPQPSTEAACEQDYTFARAALASWGHQPAPPAEGEVGELVEWLRGSLDSALQSGNSKSIKNHCRLLDVLGRATTPPVAIPGEKYHEDMGPVTWWRLPVDEPPWVGTPNDSDWPGYHTHFTPAPTNPLNANALPTPEATND